MKAGDVDVSGGGGGSGLFPLLVRFASALSVGLKYHTVMAYLDK